VQVQEAVVENVYCAGKSSSLTATIWPGPLLEPYFVMIAPLRKRLDIVHLDALGAKLCFQHKMVVHSHEAILCHMEFGA